MEDKSEYLIINKTAVQKRIAELETKIIDNPKMDEDIDEFNLFWITKQNELQQVLSNSIPLIPEIEKSFDSGVNSVILRILNEKDNTIGHSKGFITRAIGEFVEPYSREYVKKDYLSNLKLDI
jgi:hypothetical protein